MFPLVFLGLLMAGAAAKRRRQQKRPPEEKERQQMALQAYEDALDEGDTPTRAVEIAKDVYRNRGGKDVAFIARLNALDNRTWQN